MNDTRAAAAALRGHRASIAATVTDAFLQRHPDWTARYGDAARTRGVEDAGYHLDFVSAALATQTPAAFAAYARWAARVLHARNIDPMFLRETFEQIAAVSRSFVDSGGAAAVDAIIGEGVAALAQPSPMPSSAAPGEEDPARRAFTEAALAGDRRAALRVVEEAIAGGLRLEVYVRIIEPSQIEIGRLWESNRISVAQEHIATAVTQYVVSVVYDSLPRGASRPCSVLVSGVEGELHQLGAQLVADALELEGCRVQFLGSNVPGDHLVRRIAETRPQVIGLSTMMLFNVPRTQLLIERIRGEFSDQPTILVGGGAYRAVPDVWQSTGADAYAPDVLSALAAVRERTGAS